MNNEFVTLTTFKADGLGEIETALNRITKTQDLATVSAEKYKKATDAVSRSLSIVERVFNGPTFRQRVRETDHLARSQERMTRTLERQAAVARLMTPRGMLAKASQVGGFAAGAAGLAATTGFGMGVAGLSGTVPMARFQAQMDRLQWEFGNLLTPYIDYATKKTAQAANWLGRQDTKTQDRIGGALLVGAGLTGANVLSKAFGMGGLGSLGLGVAGAAGTAGRAAFAGLGRAALGPLSAAAMAYGIGGMRGWVAGGNAVRGTAAAGGLLARAGAGALLAGATNPVGAGITAATFAFQPAIASHAIGRLNESRERMARNDLTGLEGIGDEYTKRFSGLQGAARNKAINEERARQLRLHAEGASDIRGGKTTWLGQAWSMLLGNTGETGKAEEAEKRMKVLERMREGKPVPTTQHRANAFTGGEFREIGSSYYAAMGEAEKRGFMTREGQKEGSLLEQNVADIAAAVRNATNGTNQAGGNKLNYSIPRY